MKGNSYDVIGNDNEIKEDQKISISDKTIENSITNTPNIEEKATDGGVVQSIKNIFNRTISNNEQNSTNTEPAPSDWRQKAINLIHRHIEVEKSYKLFFIILSIGLGLVCLSLIFLPVIAFSPQKFVMCFGLGSMTIITSFLFMYGTVGYFEILFSKQRFPFTVLFLSSMILGIYFAYLDKYIYSILCAAAQLLSLVMFVLSFTPGGQTGIRFIGRTLLSPFSNFWMRLRGQSYLPS
jgi:hypothetical protein